MFSALEKQRTVLPPWGRSVVSFCSWANECYIFCVTAVRLKEKKLYVEGRPEGSLSPLRKVHSSAVRLLSTAAAAPTGVCQHGAATQPWLSHFCWWVGQAGLTGKQGQVFCRDKTRNSCVSVSSCTPLCSRLENPGTKYSPLLQEAYPVIIPL